MTWQQRNDARDGFRRFELQWRRTWEDSSHDFSARDGDLLVGRTYRHTGGPTGGKWFWSMIAKIGNRVGTDSGTAEERDEACLAVERSYRRFRQQVGAN